MQTGHLGWKKGSPQATHLNAAEDADRPIIIIIKRLLHFESLIVCLKKGTAISTLPRGNWGKSKGTCSLHIILS